MIMLRHEIIETFIYDKLDKVPSCHSSSLVELPNGDMMAVWFGGETEGSPDAAHYMAILRKGATTWDKAKLFWKIDGQSAGNPRLFCDASQRVWALLPVNNGTWCGGGTMFYYRTSEDSGITWSKPVHVPELDTLLGKNKPVLRPDGKIIIPVSRELQQTSAAIILDPKTKEWTVSAEIAIGENIRCIQPTFANLSDGRVLALLRTNTGFIWKTYSENEGKTWSLPKKTMLPNNNSGIDVARLANGHLMLIFNNTSSQKRTPLNAAISTDDGETWSYQMPLESEEGEFSYPAVMQANDATIHITYTYLKGKRHTSGRNGTHIKHLRLTEDVVLNSSKGTAQRMK